MARLVAELAASLEREAIPCCQWKGAAALERALRGERDIDLLVRPADFARVEALLSRGGWKAARARFAREAPGTAHYFGYDPPHERLLHLHLHDRVLTGEDWINSHALPLDAALLESPAARHGLGVPTPALEALLTVLKHAIRWGSLPDVVTAWLRPPPGRAELARLLSDEHVEAATRLLREHCPALDEATFRSCAASLRAGRWSAERLQLAARVRRALRPYATCGRGARAAAYARVCLARTRRLLDANRRDKAPRRGGALIAFVGPDANARAACVDQASRWLGQAFAVYAGAARSVRAAPATDIVLCDGEPEARAASLRIEARAPLDDAARARIWAAL